MEKGVVGTKMKKNSENSEMYLVKCERCSVTLWDSSEKEENIVCGECAEKMSEEELKGKRVEDDYPTRCDECNSILEYKREYPGGRKDFERGDKHFCSEECFRKHLGIPKMDKNSRLLDRKERAYIISKLTNTDNYAEDFDKLTPEQEEELIRSIINKIQAPQELPLD